MMVSAHHAPHALGRDGRPPGAASTSSMTSVAATGAYQRAMPDHRRLVAEVAQQAVRRPLEGGTTDDGADGRHAASRAAARASRTPGTASTGSIDTTGLDGAMTTASACSDRLEHAGGGCAAADAVHGHRTDLDVVALAHEVLLERQLAGRRWSWTLVRTGSSVTGSSRAARPHAPGDLRGDLRQRQAPARAARSGTGGCRGPGRRGVNHPAASLPTRWSTPFAVGVAAQLLHRHARSRRRRPQPRSGSMAPARV